MDLRQIEYVGAVARTMNFTRAAVELHVAQPALSAAIRRLETELGVQLFRRTSRRVELTDAGVAFLERSRHVAVEIERLGEEMHAYARGVVGRLRISAWYHVDPELGRFLRQFLIDNPRVDMAILEVPTEEAVGRLRDGELDIAMLVLLPAVDLAGLEHLVVRRERYHLLLPIGHPLANRPSVRLADVV